MTTSFFLTLVVIGIVLTINGVTPFGSNNLLVGDMGAQYSPFFTGLRHIITTGQFTTYSFSIGIGENVFPLTAYYLLSPFNLILLLFSASQVPTAITWILMFKMATMALTMSFYLTKHFHHADWIIPFFAVAFSLCGFVTANFINIMWLDGLIYLPLICYGIDQVKTGQRSYQLFTWLTICILSNYYIGYMIGLFTLIYAVNTIISTNESHQGVKTLIIANQSFIRNFIWAEILSGLTSMVVLLPVALGMLQTAKKVPTLTNSLLRTQYGLEVLSQFGIGGQAFSNRLFHAPAIFSSLEIAILFVVFFSHPTIPKQHKLGTGLVFSLLMLSMLIGPINIVWQMFNKPDGSPFRYSFLISFVMIAAAYEAWLAKPNDMSKHLKVLPPVIITVALIVGFVFVRYGVIAHHSAYLSIQPTSLKLLVINIGLVLAFSALTLIPKSHLFTLGIGSLILLETSINFSGVLASEPLGNQAAYQKEFRIETNQLASQPQPKATLFRINYKHSHLSSAFQKYYFGYNDPLAFGFNGIQEYSSTLDEATRQSLEKLGLFSKNKRRISNIGITAVSEMLLGVKTNLNTITTKPNQTYVGMGFPVTTAFINLHLKAGDLFSNLESILQSIKPMRHPYFITEIAKPVAFSNRQTILSIMPKQSGPLYLTMASARFHISAIKIAGQQRRLVPNKLHKKYLVRLGNAIKGRSIHIQLTGIKRTTLTNLHIRSLDVPQLLQLVSQLKRQSFQPTFNRNHLTGTVTRTTINQHWLYTSIPYDSGWSATINGQPVTTKRVLGDFTALPLQKTINHISMTYHVPGLMIGFGLSFLGLLGYAWGSFDKRFRS